MGWILAEAGMGLAVGLAVAFLTEGFQMGAQIISLQAGYSFASTIDPTSGADSTVLIMIAQTTAGLLFFATGMDRQILRAFADSLTSHPPGHFAISAAMVTRMIQAGSSIFTTGLRLVLPLLALLLMVEISLALLTRLNSQLHLMQISMSYQDAVVLDLAGLAAADFSAGVRPIRQPRHAVDSQSARGLAQRSWRIPAKQNSLLANAS